MWESLIKIEANMKESRAESRKVVTETQNPFDVTVVLDLAILEARSTP